MLRQAKIKIPKIAVIVLILSLFVFQFWPLSSPINQNHLKSKELENYDPSRGSSIASTIYKSDFDLEVISTDDYFEGMNLLSISRRNITDYLDVQNITAIIDMTGAVVNAVETQSYGPSKIINSTTALLSGTDHVLFWNFFDNTTKRISLGSTGHHHDFEFNPLTNTIIIFKQMVEIIDSTEYLYDQINEYDLSGNLVWSINTSSFIPPSHWCPYEDIDQTLPDITHSNTLFWDIEEDIIFYNSRNTNTFYKINHSSSEVVWGLGEYGNFTLFDRNGIERSNLFYHAHSIEMINSTMFILFDNDYHNQTYSQNRKSRILEISINESSMEAIESWSYTPSLAYYSATMGDADRLPNGNRLGTFGTYYHPYGNYGARISEVDDEGKLVWEMNFLNSGEYCYSVYRTERFQYGPILNSPQDINILSNQNASLTWETWYSHRTKSDMLGSYQLYQDSIPIASDSLIFNKFWERTQINFTLSNLSKGTQNLTLIVTDDQSKLTSDTILLNIVDFYLNHTGPEEIELGASDTTIAWYGETVSDLQCNITSNSTLIKSFVWNGSSFSIDIAQLGAGVHLIELRLWNGTLKVYNETLIVTVSPNASPTINPLQQDTIEFIWNQTISFSWVIYDLSPYQWKIFLDGNLTEMNPWLSDNETILWIPPVLDEGEYNITFQVEDTFGSKTSKSHQLIIHPPTTPIIAYFLSSDEVIWGTSSSELSWEVHGGLNWTIYRNGTLFEEGTIDDGLVTLQIANWQSDNWLLGKYNITLLVSNTNSSTSKTEIIRVFLDFGDAYANEVLAVYSEAYLDAANALGSPDGNFARIFLDYGNGYLSLDMGKDEEIINLEGNDFWVFADHGNYSVFASNDLNERFKFVGRGIGNKSFDLADAGIDAARYIRVEYYYGETVYLDAIVGVNYNKPFSDETPPLIEGPPDFQLLENESYVYITWIVTDATPWNYTILIDGSLYISSPWNGSDISITYPITSSNQINFTIIVYDVVGNVATDSILVDIIQITNTSHSSTDIIDTTSITSYPDYFPLTIFTIILSSCAILVVYLVIVKLKTSSE